VPKLYVPDLVAEMEAELGVGSWTQMINEVVNAGEAYYIRPIKDAGGEVYWYGLKRK